MNKGNLAIVGIGEVPTGTYPQRSRWDIIYDTCIQAVRDAGIDKNDIEGVITVAPQAQPRLAAEISFGKIPEERLGELYALVRSFVASKAGSPGPGIMAKLREVRIEGPADFAANLDLYLSGEKSVGEDVH